LVDRRGETAIDADGRRTPVSLEGTGVQADTDRAHDHLVVGKALGRVRRSCPREVRRRGDKQARASAQPARRGSRIRQRSEAKRHVDALGHQVLVAIVQREIDAQCRMKLHEGRQPRDHFPQPETQGQRDTQGATQLAGSARGVIGLFQRHQDRLDSRQVVRARFRQRQASSGARHQSRAHLTLELTGDARCGGL
jgi:hypothetical protein